MNYELLLNQTFLKFAEIVENCLHLNKLFSHRFAGMLCRVDNSSNKDCVNPAALAHLSVRTAFIAGCVAVAGWAMMNRLASSCCE